VTNSDQRWSHVETAMRNYCEHQLSPVVNKRQLLPPPHIAGVVSFASCMSVCTIRVDFHEIWVTTDQRNLVILSK